SDWFFRKDVARRGASGFFWQTPLFSGRGTPFPGGSHPGQLLKPPSGGPRSLDLGFFWPAWKAAPAALIQRFIGAITLDAGKLGSTLLNLSENVPDQKRVKEIVSQALDKLVQDGFPGIGWVTELLDSAVIRAGIRLHGHLLLFRKALLTLEG